MAANLAGGEEGLVGYLKTQALQGDPSPFMAGLAKLLPLMLEGSKDAPLRPRNRSRAAARASRRLSARCGSGARRAWSRRRS
jgi:hypothetical protein